LSTTAGVQIPVIPFVEVPGNTGTIPPSQIVSKIPKLNVGVMLGLTVTVSAVGVAHCPASGVNEYVSEFWLSTVVGLHIPVTPFVDVLGNAGTGLPAHIVNDVPKLNAGAKTGFTVTVNVDDIAHWPASGVNV
jgi:hypothetical protein